MARFNVSRLNNQIRQAQRRVDTALRRAKYEVEHPMIEIRCTCGHRSRVRRSIHSLPSRCPACSAPVTYT